MNVLYVDNLVFWNTLETSIDLNHLCIVFYIA